MQLLFALALLYCFIQRGSAQQSGLDLCPEELGDFATCLAKTAAIEAIQQCVDCVGRKYSEEELASVTSCETFNVWYCDSLSECATPCGVGCAIEALRFAVCVLTSGGQTPPSDDCAVGCINTTISAGTQPVEQPTAPPTEQEITACSQDGMNLCNETFQVCYRNIADGRETCGNCIKRYVEFPPPTPEDETPPPCVLIEDLPWEDFFTYFQDNVSSVTGLCSRFAHCYAGMPPSHMSRVNSSKLSHTSTASAVVASASREVSFWKSWKSKSD